MTCDEVRALAGELALGLVTGDERAAAITHLAGCAGCRAEVEELAVVADRLLLLAPEVEPPPGFTERVIAAVTSTAAPGATRRRRYRLLAVAAAAVVVTGAAGATGWAVARPDRETREYVGALKALGGSSLQGSKLVTPDGTDAGDVFAYGGMSSWVFVSVQAAVPDGDYAVMLQPHGASAVRLATLHVQNGKGSVGMTTTLDVTRLRWIEVCDAQGRTAAQAPIP